MPLFFNKYNETSRRTGFEETWLSAHDSVPTHTHTHADVIHNVLHTDHLLQCYCKTIHPTFRWSLVWLLPSSCSLIVQGVNAKMQIYVHSKADLTHHSTKSPQPIKSSSSCFSIRGRANQIMLSSLTIPFVDKPRPPPLICVSCI